MKLHLVPVQPLTDWTRCLKEQVSTLFLMHLECSLKFILSHCSILSHFPHGLDSLVLERRFFLLLFGDVFWFSHRLTQCHLSLLRFLGFAVAKVGRLSTKDAVLFLCDMQEKFRPNIFQFPNIVSNASRLLQVWGNKITPRQRTHLYHLFASRLHLVECILLLLSLQASRILGIPQVLTEQYPKGLGPTVPELGAEDLKAHTKTSFTMMTEEVQRELQALGNPKQAILCGIEAHACIAVR